MANLRVTLNEATGDRRQIALSGTVVYHEVFNANAEDDNNVSTDVDYLYFNDDDLVDATSLIIYSQDLNDNIWKVNVRMVCVAGFDDLDLEPCIYDDVIYNSDGNLYEEWSKFNLDTLLDAGNYDYNPANDRIPNFRYELGSTYSTTDKYGVCTNQYFEAEKLLLVLPLWNVASLKAWDFGELSDQIGSGRTVGIRIENVSNKRYGVILFKDDNAPTDEGAGIYPDVLAF